MGMEIFMRFVGFLLFLFILGMGIKKLTGCYPTLKISFLQTQYSVKYPLKEIFIFLFRDKTTLKKLLFTIGILLIFRIGYFISLPGINTEILREFFESISRSSGNSLSVLYFGSPALCRLSVFALGIMPVLSACLVVQLVCALTPRLKHLLFSGEKGRIRVKKYSYILTIWISVIQSFFISKWLQNPTHFQGLNMLTIEGWQFSLLTVATLTSAVALHLFGAELINKHGIGNGIVMFAFSGILVRVIYIFRHTANLYFDSKLSFFPIVFVLLLAIAFCYWVFFVTSRVRTIEAKSLDGQERVLLPLRLSWVGTAPLIIAQSIYLFPMTITSFFGGKIASNVSQFFDSIWVELVLMSAFIFLSTYIYTVLIFKPSYVHNLLNRYKFKLDIPEGGNFENHLDKIVSKLLISTAVFLVVITLFPKLVAQVLALPSIILSLFGTSGFVILIGIFFDLVKQLEFLMDKAQHNIEKWSIAYVAFDEVEAEIKKSYLKSNGMVAEIEPLRYTWGMPIRTAIDQYRIYVPKEKLEESRNMLIA